MIGFSNWLTETSAIDETFRAVKAWNRINDKPTAVAFKTVAGTTLAAQTVRIESDNTVTESEGAAGQGPVRKVIVFGVQNHPIVTDTDMKEGYRFNYGNDQYRIVDVISTLGELQGIGEATG
jgi:hypothetical protein